MLLRVDVEDAAYVVDVGFGGQTLTGPVLLQADLEQVTPHEPFRLARRGEDWVLYTLVQGEWKALYRFDLQPQCLPDYELASWYLSHHPQSHFVTSLVAARAAADRRYALRNNSLAIHARDGHTERRTLTSGEELREVLEINFCLTLPDSPVLDSALERIARAG
jgi:N-hydroxyarylamine O-acetyltransferase